MEHPRVILDRLGIHARKSLSQNFLTSPHWVHKLTEAVLAGDPVDEIWEVGPGLGALTERLLAQSPVPVRAFEYDRTLAPYLAEKFPRLHVHEGDFLKADLKPLLPPGRKVALLSNLPYHISSPVLFRLLEWREPIVRWVLTFQKEFADRLVAQPRTPDYSSLSVLIQLETRRESLGILPPGAFYPKPDVDSAALKFIPAATPVDRDLAELIRIAFAHRRKQLKKNLSARWPRIPWEQLLSDQGLATTVRPEELTPLQFTSLNEARRRWFAKHDAQC